MTIRFSVIFTGVFLLASSGFSTEPHPDAKPNAHPPGEVDVPANVKLIVADKSKLPGIILDETDAVLVGEWQYSTHTPPYVGIGYLHDMKSGKGKKSVTWNPIFPKAGRYEVRVSHCYNVRRATNTPVTIRHAKGETTVRIDQQETPEFAGLFRSLGVFEFGEGKSGSVTISNDGTDPKKVVIADAVQFLPVQEDNLIVKPRIIVTTDGESDDRCSMNRFLLYSYQWRVEGLIYSSSKHHWKGRGKVEGHKWHNTTWIEEQLDAYAKVYKNLIKHQPEYPTPTDLKQNVFVGNIDLEGDLAHPTPGSDRIVQVLLDDDPSPVWMQAWGGPNTIARALKSIEEKHPHRMEAVSKKARIFLVAEQDQTFKNYISKVWPDVETLQSSKTYQAIAYRWRDHMPDEIQTYFSKTWLKESILEDHGPLCSLYEPRPDGTFRSEGDSPAFLHMINVGLRTLENPTFGGWGGRFDRQTDRWRSTPDDGDYYKPVLRWAIAFQNDWATKADWCVSSFADANHAPVAVFDHPVDLPAHSGESVQLSAKGTSDPDGDALTFKWWQYAGPGTYSGKVTIQDADTPTPSFVLPADGTVGQTIHLICEVTDQGQPPLTRYQRAIVTISK